MTATYRMYPKHTYPKEAHCPHRYWAYVRRGEDDVDKECFCDIDDGPCFGRDACEKDEEEKSNEAD